MQILVTTLVTVGAAALPALPVAAGTSREVGVDVRPPNVNLAGRAAIPVAILTTSTFDATSVNVPTVCFGDAENATQRDCTESHGTGHVEDVDADGDSDLLLHFDSEASGIDSGDERACLEGMTLGGQRIHGCDGINVRNGVSEPDLPDLAPSVVAEPASTGPAAAVTWTATLLNEGTGAITFAPGTRVLRFSAPASLTGVSVTAPADYTCATTGTTFDCTNDDPDTLLVNGTRVFTLTGTVPNLPGPVTVNVVADPLGVVVETDETDNTRAATSVVEAGNLTAALSATPAALSPGEPLALSATVTSTGIAATFVPAGTRIVTFEPPAGMGTGAITAPPGFSCSGLSCATTTARTLAVGESLAFTLAATAPATPAEYVAAVKADPADAVNESDESDNRATVDLLVEAANLVTTVATLADPVGTSGPVEWSAELLNMGPGRIRIPAGARAISFELSEALSGVTVTGPSGFSCSAVDATTYVCSTTALTTLLAGDRLAFSLRGTAPAAPGSVTLVVTADPANAVIESDETDNASSSTATAVAANLTVTAAPTANPVDAVASTTWNAVIQNTGGALDIASGTHLLRFSWPTGFANVAVATPAGYSCFIVATNTADCAVTSALTLPANGTVPVTVFGTSPRTPGPLTLTFTVDPLEVVTETNEADNVALATTIVQPPDLAMTLTVSPDPGEAGFSTTWVARIANDGPSNARISTGMTLIRFEVPSGMTNLAVSTPSGYTCFLAATLVVDCTTTATQNIPAGGHVDITLFGTAPREPGTIAMTATADPLEAIPEGDETDNAATRSLLLNGPDLVTTLTATPNPANAGHSTTWSARIVNNGPGRARVPTGTTAVRFDVPAGMTNLAVATPSGYTCFIAATNVVECTTTSTMTYEVGTPIDISFFGTAPRALAPLSMTFTADPLGGIPEIDETNNAATFEVPVQGPNLVAEFTSVTPDPANAGHSVTWVARITNVGPAPLRLSTGMTPIRFDVPPGLTNLAVSTPSGYTCFIAATNVVECDLTALTTLAVGAAHDISFFGTAPRALAPLTMTLTADPDGVIPEEVETDNVATSTVDVQGPNLVMTLTAAREVVDAATSTQWTARITNAGPAPLRMSTGMTPIRFDVPPGLTNLAVSTPSGYTCFIAATNVVECEVTALTTIAVGAAHDITFFGTVPRQPGTLTLTATADPFGAIPEEAEGDNIASSTVTVQPPDLVTTVTTPSSTVPAGGLMTWVVRVANEGPAVARLASSIDVVRLTFPDTLPSPTITPPSGYACVIEAPGVAVCNPSGTQTLPVGGIAEFVFEATAPGSPQTVDLTAVADPNGVVPEEDELNNSATAPIVVS